MRAHPSTGVPTSGAPSVDDAPTRVPPAGVPLGDAAELRPLGPWYAAEFAGHVARAGTPWTPWLPGTVAADDEEGARGWLADHAGVRGSGSSGLQGIWLDGELVGGALLRIMNTGAGACELGVWTEDRAVRATGGRLATRAARHMITEAFRAGAHRVEWHTVPADACGVLVARRLGMTLDGVLREAFSHGDVWHDVQVWSLLSHEWAAGHGRGIGLVSDDVRTAA